MVTVSPDLVRVESELSDGDAGVPLVRWRGARPVGVGAGTSGGAWTPAADRCVPDGAGAASCGVTHVLLPVTMLAAAWRLGRADRQGAGAAGRRAGAAADRCGGRGAAGPRCGGGWLGSPTSPRTSGRICGGGRCGSTLGWSGSSRPAIALARRGRGGRGSRRRGRRAARDRLPLDVRIRGDRRAAAVQHELALPGAVDGLNAPGSIIEQGASTMEDPRRRDIALFRYGLIRQAADPALSPARAGPAGPGTWPARNTAARRRVDDGGPLDVGPLDPRLPAGGFDALVPAKRTPAARVGRGAAGPRGAAQAGEPGSDRDPCRGADRHRPGRPRRPAGPLGPDRAAPLRPARA